MFEKVLYREIYLIPIISGFIIQIIKVILYSAIEGKFVFEKFTQTDGMPNLHAGVFSSLAACIGIKYGFSSILFSVVTTYSVIIIHDTLRLKGEKGRQADLLNMILTNVEQYSKLNESLSIKVLHYRPLDVLSGAVVGIVATIVLL